MLHGMLLRNTQASVDIVAAVSSSLVGMACDRHSLLAGCVSEAVRLRAPGIAVRMAACDLAMPLGGDRTVNVKKVRHVIAAVTKS